MVVDTIVHAWSQAMRPGCRPGIMAVFGGSVVPFGVHPKIKRRFVVQSIEGGG